MKYLKYIRNLLLNKKWEMVFYIDDIVISFLSFGLILLWKNRINQFDFIKYGAILYISCLILIVSQLFGILYLAKKAFKTKIICFYKIIGFKKVDFILYLFHRCFLSNIAYSLLVSIFFSTFYFNVGTCVSMVFYFLCILIEFMFTFFLINISKKNILKNSIFKNSIIKKFKLSRKKFKVYACKDFLYSLHDYSIVTNIIIIMFLLFVLICFKVKYEVSLYIICSCYSSLVFDYYEIDRKQSKFLSMFRLSKLQLFRYKLFLSYAGNCFMLIFITIVYILNFNEFSMITILYIAFIIVFTFIQELFIGVVCCNKLPEKWLVSESAIIWLLAILPIISIFFYVYILIRSIHSREEGNYICWK